MRYKLLIILAAVTLIVLLPITAAQGADKGAGPVAHWRFDEGGGPTAYDESANNNDGTLVNHTKFVPGKIGKALQFDGTDDYVVSTSPSFIPTATSPLTLSVWIKPDSTQNTAQVGIVGWDGGTGVTGGKRMICIRSTGEIYFWGSSADFNPALTWDANVWQHIVLTVTSGKVVSFYKNGMFIDSTTISSLVNIPSDNSIYIGVRETFSQEFNGLIDDVRIYNYARTADQILVDYNAGSAAHLGAGTDPNEGNPPVGYWTFDENTGTTTYDRSGNNNNGTITGATWTQGKHGSCLNLDGSSDYVGIPDSASLDITSAITMTAWVKPNEANQSDHIISKKESGGYCMGINLDGFGDKKYNTMLYINGAYYHLESTSSVALNTWAFVAMTFDGTDMKIYVNGVLENTATHAGSIGLNNTYVFIGAESSGSSPDTSQCFNGLIDEVKVYDYARTAAQIAYDYNRGKPVAHYKFDEGGGSIAHNAESMANSGAAPVGWWRMDNDWTDSSGNANNGTAVDNATFSTSSKTGPYCGAFDGAGDYVTIPDSPTLDISNAITIEAWVNLQSYASHYHILGKRPGCGASNYQLHKNATSHTVGMYCDGVSVNGSSAMPFGEWVHLAATVDTSTNTTNIYMNGKLDGTSSAITSMTPNSGALIIGEVGCFNGYVNGKMDDVRIYDYARTAEQIYNDYKTTHGTMVGSGIKFVDGKIGKALQFNGSSDCVKIGTVSSYSSALTVEAWVNHSASADWDDIVAGGCGDILFGFTNNQLSFGGQCNSPFGMTTYSTNINGAWHHVVGVYDGSTAKVYVDGVQVASSSRSGSFTPGSLSIGSAGASEYFTGLIDDVRIYNYARTAEQILEDYTQGASRLGAQSAGVKDPWGGALPLYHWKMDENTGVLAQDASQNNINGTVSGATWIQGVNGPALSFDGSNDYLLLPSYVYLDDAVNWTASAWVKTSDSSTNSVLAPSTGGPAANNLCVSSSKICYQHYDGAWQYKYGTSTVANGNWHFLTWVNHSNQTIDLYVDGVRETAGVASVVTNNGPMNQIGRDWGSTFNGSIDDVRVYNYAMTQAQIAWDYNRGKPLAHWRMNEATSGSANGQTIYDDSGSIDGTGNYGANTTGMAWTTGKFGGALDFDGTDDYVGIGNFIPTLTEGSLSMWFKRDTSKAGYQMLFTDGGSQFEICYSTDTLQFYVDNSQINTTGANNNGTWQHVAGTFSQSGNIKKLYLNGVEVASGVYTGDATAATRYFGSRGGSYPFDGSIDDIRVYNYARTADQVKQDYLNGAAARLGD